MARQSPFPSKDADFNDYIQISVPYVVANKTRLGVSNANATALQNLKTDPSTGWDVIYPKSQDPDQKTNTINEQKDELKKQITERLRIIYADIPESALTNQDRQKLGLKKRDTVPSERPKIETAPYVSLKAISGAHVEIVCRVESDSTRASRHKDADAIEMAYQIGGTAPASPADCPKTVAFTKARTVMDLDVVNVGKRVFAYFRWKNNSDRSKSGPWSGQKSATLTD